MKRLIALLLMVVLLMSGCAQKNEDRVSTLAQGEKAEPSEYIPSAPASAQNPLQTEAPLDNEVASNPQSISQNTEQLPLGSEEQEEPEEVSKDEKPAEEEKQVNETPAEEIEGGEEEESIVDAALTCVVEDINREFTYTVNTPDTYNFNIPRVYSWCHPSTTKSNVIYIVVRFTNATDKPADFEDLFDMRVYQRGNEELLPTYREIDLIPGWQYSVSPSESYGFHFEYNLLYSDEPIEIFINLKDTTPVAE